MQITDADRRILRQLQAEPTLTNAELAERAGTNTATCARRLERMREGGSYLGQRAVIDWAKLGYEVEVSLRVSLDKTVPRAFDEFMEVAREIPEVVELQTFLGQVDVRLSVLARDMKHYQQLYRSKILTLPHIADIEALMQVAEIKSSRGLPL